jgi:DASH complex subunit Dad2
MGSAGGLSATARLMEKRKEYDAVMALDKVSAELVDRLEGLGEDCEIMADAGQGVDVC